MIQAAFNRASSAQPLSFAGVPTLGSTGAPAVLGEVLTTHSGPEVMLVNLSSQPVSLDLSSIFSGGFSATQVTTPSIMTKVTGPGSVKTTSSAGTGDFQVEPYAVADISG